MSAGLTNVGKLAPSGCVILREEGSENVYTVESAPAWLYGRNPLDCPDPATARRTQSSSGDEFGRRTRTEIGFL